MSRPQLPVNVAAWTLHGNVKGVWKWEVGFHLALEPVGVPDVSDLAHVHADLSTFALFFWGTFASVDATFNLSRLEWRGDLGYLIDDALIDTPGSGGNTAAANVAAGITWQTGELGRGRFGRSFMPALPASAIGEGAYVLDPPASDLQTAINDFLAQVNSVSSPAFPVCKLVLLHRRQNDVVLDPPYVTPIVGGRLQPRIASSYRRLRHANVI